MEEYPEELRTPPVSLVALVGVPELHSIISSHLHMEQSPINTLALPDFSKVAVIGGKERKPPDARLPPPVGILKIDWLWKHRTKVPAALVVLLSRDQVYGDPAQWLQVCTNLDNIKNVIRGRNTKLLVVVVQPTLLSGDVIEDRLMALRKRAEVDAKCFHTFISQDPLEQKRSLARLGSILGELVTIFYREEGRRVKARLEKKTFSSTELGVRYNFKVAVYAEFRRDWVEALKFYETAYTLLQEIVTTPIELQPVQWLVELKTVAEQLHFKVSTLLLHGGKETEAVKWFRQHLAFYKRLVGPLESIFIHWAWVSKQFLVFGDLLLNSLTKAVTTSPSGSAALPEPPVTERELQPGYYYQVAAGYMIERRRSFDSISTMFDSFEGKSTVDVLAGPPEEVGPPLYVGQAPCLLGRGSSFDVQCPTEKEYIYHAAMQEKLFPHSLAAISLLKKAYEQYKLIQAGRMVYHVASEMGREYFNARDYANAKQLFDSVAGMYRQEAWVALLWASLGYLRECARQLQLLKEYVEYTLEMAALPTSVDSDGTGHEGSFGPEVGPAGPLCHTQRQQLFEEIIKLLQGRHSVLPAREGEIGLSVTESQPVSLNIDVVSPLRAVLSVCVAFHEQTVKPGMTTSLTLSLLTHLPQTLELEELEVHFNQSSCNLVFQSSRREAVLDADQLSVQHKGSEVKTGFDLQLEPNKWKRFSIDITPGQSGKLECLTVIARVGNYSSICCQVESPASRDEVSFWKFEPQLEMSPMKDSSLSFFGQKAIQVEEPEALMDVMLEAFGPGLIGELFPVGITVRSRGHAVHAGEMKISLAEPSTVSLISPRVTPSALDDSLLVELYTLGLISQEGDAKEIQNLRKFSGVLTMPAIETDSTWSTMIYVRWRKPKPVSLFVSVSYQSEIVVTGATQPLRFFVHKGLQMECEEPLAVNHRYMAPFRRDSLLLGGLKKGVGPLTKTLSLPLSETSTLLVVARNTSSVQLGLLSITVDEKDSRLCSVRPTRSSYGRSDPSTAVGSCRELSAGKVDTSSSVLETLQGVSLMPGETYTKLFSVRPTEARLLLDVGTICVKWQRLETLGSSTTEMKMPVSELRASEVVDFPNLSRFVTTRIILPAVQVEKPLLLVTFHCPPHALLGVPFTLSHELENLTALIQEVKFSVVDSPSFILSGPHSDSVHILPYSKDVISYKLVPLASGQQQLPQFNLTAARYNAGFQQSVSSIQLFVFPSSPYLKPKTPYEPHSRVGSSLTVSEVK